MEQFLTWDMFLDYPTFILIVFTIVAFTKDIKFIEKIPTQKYCYIVALIYRIIVTVYFKEFTMANVFLYLVDAIFITLATKGLADKNSESVSKKEEKENATSEEL